MGVKSKANLYAIIKNGADVADSAGVNEFQSKYFNNNPVYMDLKDDFYKALGSKTLLSQPLRSWNPFTLYSDFKALGKRLSEKKTEGNLIGEGLVKGGLLVVTVDGGVIYQHDEETGSAMPYQEIEDIIAALPEVGVTK
jgi:hypothetical protein